MPSENANNRNPDGTPGAQEWAEFNAFLAGQGYTPQQRQAAIGLTPNGRSRAEIEGDLLSWQRGSV